MFKNTTNLVHPDSVYAIAFTRDGSRFATSSFDKKVRLYDAATLELERAMHTGASFMHAVAFDTAGTRVASGGKSLCMFDVATKKRIKTKIKKLGLEIRGIVFTEDDTRVWVAGGESWCGKGYVVCIDLMTGAKIIDTKLGDCYFSLGASPDGSLLAAASVGDGVVILDSSKGDVQQRIDIGGWLYRTRFSPDGQSVWVSGDPHVIRGFDVSSGTVVAEVQTRGMARDFAFDPLDPNVIVGVFFNRYSQTEQNGAWVEAFDVTTGASVWCADLTEMAGFTQSLAFSPDGSVLITGIQEIRGELEVHGGEKVTLDDGDALMFWHREA